MRRIGKNDKVLRPVHANVAIQKEYERRLKCLIDELHNSIVYWLSAAYKRNEPRIVEAADEIETKPLVLAQDAIPAAALRRAIRRLTKRWKSRFDEAADELADWFGQAVSDRSDKALQAILRKGGISVRFKMSRAQRDVLHATVNANVSLIKSIPQKYLGAVEGIVMRGVQTGRDLQQVTKALQKEFGVTRRRAEFISRDQASKATSSLHRARLIELGIQEAIWIHSHAGKTPRPSHVAMHGKKYDVVKGMWDPDEGEWITPGFLINCRCVSRPIVKGFS
jgi:SPP1 gp7 family putative phage head morphogenesis protein